MNECSCDILKIWVKDPNFPLEFDAETNEYSIVHGKQGKFLISYCPNCGGKLPESRRGTFFEEPDQADVKEVREIMRSVSDIESMRKILGEPSQAFQWPLDEEEHSKLYGIKKWKTQFDYADRWKTLTLSIFEGQDGSIEYFFAGKEIPRKGE